MRRPFSPLWWLLALLCACSDDFDPPSRVIDLRVLAVRADRPFALPSGEVRLEALVHDPEARPLAFGFGLCIEETSSIALDCLRALRFEELTVVREPRFVFTVPAVSAPFVGVVVVACPGEIVPGDTLGVPLSCLDAARRPRPLSEFELGIKRVYLRPTELNANPTIEAVRWDGEPWPEGELKTDRCLRADAGRCEQWAEHTVEVRAPSAVERSVDREGLPVTEQLVVQLYATGGTFDDDARVLARPATTFRARREDRGRITLWFVVRDDRGGVSWTSRQLALP